ncbi:hypothetical protein H633G_10828 [Metarhizium anisopliae BRIP 53284]|nr:hypothetical protein H633G_10828 [Metarhizium anisopliae BRIP 53284]
MRYLQLGLAFAGFQCLLVAAVEVVQVGPNANIDHGKIKYTRPGSDFEESFGCAEGSGKGLTFSRDKHAVARDTTLLARMPMVITAARRG